MKEFLTIRNTSLWSMMASIITPLFFFISEMINYDLYRYVAIVTYSTYGLFFLVSLKDTTDKKIRIGGYVSLVSMIYLLLLFISYKWNDVFNYPDFYIISDHLKAISFIAMLGLSAFHFMILKASGISMSIVCIPAILGLSLLGIQFIDISIYIKMTYSLAIFIPYALLGFSYYKLYKKIQL